MVRVPAVCDSCGAFFPSPIEASNAINITFSTVAVGPCPHCGGSGHVPDGTYNFIGNAIQFLSGPARSASDLERLAAILRSARQREASAEDIRKQIANEVPELQSIADLLPKTRAELYAFIGIILAILTLLLGALRKGEPSKIEINQVINQITTVVEEPGQTPAESQGPASTASKPPKVGRNDPCPCGSGKKYKKCHMIGG
jgi:hypothetical protein